MFTLQVYLKTALAARETTVQAIRGHHIPLDRRVPMDLRFDGLQHYPARSMTQIRCATTKSNSAAARVMLECISSALRDITPRVRRTWTELCEEIPTASFVQLVINSYVVLYFFLTAIVCFGELITFYAVVGKKMHLCENPWSVVPAYHPIYGMLIKIVIILHITI